MLEMDKLISLCKQRGFVFQSGEIYGGHTGFFDYGPLGVELKNNLKKAWWTQMVLARDNMVGLDSAVVTNWQTFEASGHVDKFVDDFSVCSSSNKMYRADHLKWSFVELEDHTKLGVVSAYPNSTTDVSSDLEKAAFALLEKALKKGEGPSSAKFKPLDVKDLTQASAEEIGLIPSPATGAAGALTPPKKFNLLLQVQVGAEAERGSAAVLRPETAQGIFVNFKNIVDSSRMKIPFGVAQIGKAFRNEITPRHFLFRTREFEMLEIEYFIDPQADFQAELEAWVVEMEAFLERVGVDRERMAREVHPKDKLAHYARSCTDITFQYPFSQKHEELMGVAARGGYDLEQHSQKSGKAMEYQVPGPQGRRFVPHVIEPSLGVDRLFLAVMLSAFATDQQPDMHGKLQERSFLRFPPWVAPIPMGVFPWRKNQAPLVQVARSLVATLRRRGFNARYDADGMVGKCYRRMDEVGTPYCCCVDPQTLEDGTVTIRDRDDPMKDPPLRIRREEVAAWLGERCQMPE